LTGTQGRFAVVPAKTLNQAKSRLTKRLAGAGARARLSYAMLCDVLRALIQSDRFEDIVVVTDDPRVRHLADSLGVSAIEDKSGSLNQAVARGVDHCARRGAAVCAIVPGDVPLIGSEVVASLVQSYDTQRARTGSDLVGLVPCKAKEGTNLVMLDPAVPFRFCFGTDSFETHKAVLEAGNRPFAVFEAGDLAMDIDTDRDLDLLIARVRHGPADVAPATRAALEDLGLTHQPGGAEASGTAEGSGEAARAAEDRVDPRADDFDLLGRALPLSDLVSRAAVLRDAGYGNVVTYSRKVFIPLTHLCRDTCHYCVFAKTPREVDWLFMSVEDVLEIARKGAAAGCREALFTLGEKPELRYRAAREWLDARGFESTLAYVAHVAEIVRRETGLLPHINAGCMTPDEIAMLRRCAPSMGIMLENVSPRLCERGGPHFGSPDKDPKVRLQTIADAGRAGVPFTTGILIGIGETRLERLQSLFAILDLHRDYGHIQEIIVQNFVPKPSTKMAETAAADEDDLLWTIAMARLIFGPDMSIQAPPNLARGSLQALIGAGINDWGGVSPVTPDHVNPESPWPHLDRLAQFTAAAGKQLEPRLTIYPHYALDADRWTDDQVRGDVLRAMDGQGLAREDDWLSGVSADVPWAYRELPDLKRTGGGGLRLAASSEIETILGRCNETGSEGDIARLFSARGRDFDAVCAAADRLRQMRCGDAVTYVINRNINYTNICTYGCTFCAFSKGPRKNRGGDAPYNIGLDEIVDRAVEAEAKGATEVCLQGGIHPSFTGETYLQICAAIREALPDMHIHAFSPLEVTHGAKSLGLPKADFLVRLKEAGLNTLPGTAAEILTDRARAILCPDKLTTEQWLSVVRTAHSVGLKTTSTIMFGHVDRYTDWAMHLRLLRDLQIETGGITEFVPLGFVAHEAPLYRKGRARQGPTFRESVLMHAVSRLVLDPHIVNIQTSWVKMGREGGLACLNAGANDFGGTLMSESITRAAGAAHGQEMTPSMLEAAIRRIGRRPQQRSTAYQPICGGLWNARDLDLQMAFI